MTPGVRGRQSEWDIPTPRRPTDNHGRLTARREETGAEEYAADRAEWERAQQQLERDWYTVDESGGTDDAHNPFADYVEHDSQQEAKLIGKQQTQKMTARQKQYNKDNDMWVNSRLVQSGLVQQTGASDDDDDEDRVHLLVHDLKPKFLEGSILTKMEMVKTVLDPTSDMAVFARKGSALVRERREKRERMKATRDAVNMAGT
ncbi:hypothetical protein FBU59_002734, partial [Linderina macrospora]